MKLGVTTAHDHTVSVDAVWVNDDDTLTTIAGHHSHLATGAHPQHPRGADHRAAHGAACMVKATATLHGRSDVSYGCGSLVRVRYDARIQIVSKAARAYHAWLLMSHTSKEKRREIRSCMPACGTARGVKRNAVRGPPCLAG